MIIRLSLESFRVTMTIVADLIPHLPIRIRFFPPSDEFFAASPPKVVVIDNNNGDSITASRSAANRAVANDHAGELSSNLKADISTIALTPRQKLRPKIVTKRERYAVISMSQEKDVALSADVTKSAGVRDSIF